MKEQPKSIRRIYMVSSAAFSAASCVYGWTAPLGAALGLAASLTEDSKVSNVEEFNMVVERALERTKDSITSDTKKKILEELCKMEVEPDSLSEIIKTTEIYQAKYCTEKDAKEILNIFEIYFRDEIAYNSHLSNLYILSTGFITLEKLELVNEIFVKDEEKLDNIQTELSGINKILIEIKKGFSNFINGISFVLIAMAVFLGLNLFSNHTYDRMMIEVAPVCYGISEFLIFFLNKNGYIMSLHGLMKEVHKKHIYKVYFKIIVVFFIPIFIACSCFLLIFSTIGIDKNLLLTSTVNLIYGSIVSIGIKNMKSNKTDNNN